MLSQTLDARDAANRSISKLSGSAGKMSKEDFQKIEDNSQADLISVKSKLLAVQSQKPPTDEAELVQYLMKRLEVYEQSISDQENIIKQERDLRKQGSLQLKGEVSTLHNEINAEKQILVKKVSATMENVI